METPLSKSTSSLGTSQNLTGLAAHVDDKPLPPTPRKPSSVYSVQYDGMKNLHKPGSLETLQPPQTAFQPAAYRASTSKTLDAASNRPKMAGNDMVHAISDPILEMKQSQSQGLEKTNTHWSQSPIQRMNVTSASPSESINKYLTVPNSGTKGAKEYANSYESLLHARSSALTAFTPEPHSNYDYLPSPMSPRITDVVDRSLLPSPLTYSAFDEQQRPSSTFSSSSSDLDGFRTGINNSFRAYARRALNLPITSMEGKKRKKASSPETSKKLKTGEFQNEPVAGRRRGSVQQGISHMYDKFARMSIISQPPKSKAAISTTGANKIRAPRELRSPAIPVTRYQQLGKKAWQSTRSLKKSQSPIFKHARTSNVSNSLDEQTSYLSNPSGQRASYFSNLPREDKRLVKSSCNTPVATIPVSMTKKIAFTFHNGITQVENAMGLNKASTRLTKSERRREELKKKIVVIKEGDRTAG
ncbi:hypothetical protein MMC07_002270 [Pseudocyphellaria aurata]|nr:hypothetical protein [Pseudocyphellaria aurata]